MKEMKFDGSRTADRVFIGVSACLYTYWFMTVLSAVLFVVCYVMPLFVVGLIAIRQRLEKRVRRSHF